MTDSGPRAFPWWFPWTYLQARLVRQFIEAGAISPTTAQPFRPQSGFDELTLKHLVSDGVVHEAAPGRYYLDLRAVRTKQAIQARLLRWSLLGLLAAALVGIAAAFLG